ncbi:MAG: hypothetical protein Fur0022_36030 [Anaerolineales bacterium]
MKAQRFFKFPNNIYGRLRLTYIALATVPLIIVGLVLTWVSYDTLLNQAFDLQEELAQRVGTKVKDTIDGLTNTLKLTADVTELRTQDQAKQEEILEALGAKEKAFRELRLVNQTGEIVAYFSTTTRREQTENLFAVDAINSFNQDVEKGLFFSQVQFTGDTHQPFIVVAIPLYDRREGSLTHVLLANIRLEQISELIQDLEFEGKEGEGNHVYIVHNGLVIAHPIAAFWLKENHFSPPTERGLEFGLENNWVLMVTNEQAFEGITFTIVTETPWNDLFNLTVVNSWFVIFGLVLATAGTAAILAVFAALHITRPIQALVTVAEEIRDGNLTKQAEPSELRELDTLAKTFNSMTTQVSQTLESLEQRVADRTQALKTSAEVSRYLSTILYEDQLVDEVARLIRSSFRYYHVNIYLFDEKKEKLILVAGTGQIGHTMLSENYQIPRTQGLIGQAANTNQPVLVPDVRQNPVWLSNPWLPETQAELVVPIARGEQVLGVIDIQQNMVNGLRQEDVDLIQSIANQLAVALLNAQYFEQLVAEKLTEARQKEQAEKQLEAYRNSPMGQAEIFAQQLLTQPENAFRMMHQLAQTASQNSESAALLNHLPRLLEDTQPAALKQDFNVLTFLAKTAEGYNFLASSQNAPELLLIGLRTLNRQLAHHHANSPDLSFAQRIYQVCQAALEARTISEMTQLNWKQATENGFPPGFPLMMLVGTLTKFQNVIEALTAYERVNTLQDQLAYLVSAVERLRHVERQARTQLGNTDLNIILQITENWQAIITRTLSELQTQAKINCRLLTRHSWQHDVISVTLHLWNDGRGAALNLRVNLLPGPEYTLLDETAGLSQLKPGEEDQVVLRLRPRLGQTLSVFRLRFVVLYDDPRGPNQSEHFADAIHLISEQRQFQYIPNPYIVGTPLEPGSALFFGREDLLEAIQENLMAAHRNNLVLIGQRRMGKTSLLKQFRTRLGASYVPVYLDGQVMGLDPGMSNFFLNLATEIMFALEDQGLEIDPPTLSDFESSPASTFEHLFLPKVFSLIGDRALLILFDEFEELESAVKRGHLDASIFGFLRHLIQHTPNLSFIFCGTHHLEELVADYWNVLFNISLYQKISYLTHQEAMRLIQQPVEPFGMQYDDLALEKIWRMTSGHPYFLQLICHSLVNRHNKTQNNYITVAEVNATLDEILSTGEAHFIYLWTESTSEERMVLVAISRMIPLTGSIQAVQVEDYLSERGVLLERRTGREALHRLMLRDILKVDDLERVEEPIYRWQLGLLGLWVEKYKSLGRVMDEVSQ